MPTERNGPVKSADTMFSVIDGVHELDGAGVTELAEHIDCAKSTVHDHLRTLVDHEYLVQEGSTYQIGLKFLYHGMHAKRRMTFADVAKPTLEQLADETDEIAWLVVEEYGQAVYIEKATGDRAVQPYGEIGGRVPLQNIAAGKAILAHLPDERVREIVERRRVRERTERTITTYPELAEELEGIRERGYALNDGETITGFRAVASPIVHDGDLLGSIVVSGPANRLRGDRFRKTYPEIVTGAANAIELSLASRY